MGQKLDTRLNKSIPKNEALNTAALANVDAALLSLWLNNFQLTVLSLSLSAEENNWRPILTQLKANTVTPANSFAERFVCLTPQTQAKQHKTRMLVCGHDENEK